MVVTALYLGVPAFFLVRLFTPHDLIWSIGIALIVGGIGLGIGVLIKGQSTEMWLGDWDSQAKPADQKSKAIALVPEPMTGDDAESKGWNDCRTEMLKNLATL
jgi:hypothetical protein